MSEQTMLIDRVRMPGIETTSIESDGGKTRRICTLTNRVVGIKRRDQQRKSEIKPQSLSILKDWIRAGDMGSIMLRLHAIQLIYFAHA